MQSDLTIKDKFVANKLDLDRAERGNTDQRKFKTSWFLKIWAHSSKVFLITSTAGLTMSEVQKFYAGQTIFITGGTGFLGQVLTEKLLRSCPDIKTVFLLIRAKKGKSVQERIDALLDDKIFDNVRNDYPDYLKKVIGVPGDIAEEGLGLLAADNARLVNEVSVIFHLAATVRFTETLDKAVAINVNSVKSIVNIAKKCKNLKVGIYVSTAYSHCVRKSIEERVYPPPISYEEVDKVMKDVFETGLPEEEVEELTERVLGEWPNTYGFTKAIAEDVVSELAKEIPFAIFRPSIVIPAYAEPLPGWLSGPSGLVSLLTATGLGRMQTNLVSLDAVVDIVPVDFVCNALISSAWETAITERRHDEEIPVYNYVSRSENAITWRLFFERFRIFASFYPSNQSVYYHHAIQTNSILLFSILEFFFHLVPALLIDTIAGLFGKQPGLYKFALKIGVASRSLGYYSIRQWEFENQRVQNLWKKLGPADIKTFPFSMRNLDWDEYLMRMTRGIRKYLLGEAEGTIAQAKRRHFYLYIIHTIVRLAFIVPVLWMIWKTFYGYTFTIGVQSLAE